MKLDIYQVDAFAEKPFSGNPAAVCPLDDWLDDEVMQAIALENNLSETAFFVSEWMKGDGRYSLRWFTPEVEVDLCGHATLATSHVLWSHLDCDHDPLIFSTRSGDLTVTYAGKGLIEMDFPANRPDTEIDKAAFLNLLGVEPEVVFSDTYVMAVLPSADAVRDLEIDTSAIAALVAPNNAALIVTAEGEGDIDCVSRFFVPYANIDEDPVTGSIHTAIVPYWAERLGKKDITAYQASKRGGTLYCTDAGERVLIRGRCADYMKGVIEI